MALSADGYDMTTWSPQQVSDHQSYLADPTAWNNSIWKTNQTGAPPVVRNTAAVAGASGGGFSMVGGAPLPTGTTSVPNGGLQAFYDANSGDKAAVQKYMTDNGYTRDSAAQELKLDRGYIDHYFDGNPAAPSPLNTSSGSGGGFNLSTMSGVPTFGNTPQAGPTPWNVDGNQTVATQLERILKTDSPLMQLAKTRAQQEAQSRGLLNTTMAGTAGEAAMIDRALPIAQQDARTYGDAGQFNAGAKNTFTLADNQFNRDKSMADFNLSANEWAANKQFGRSETAADRAYLRQNQTADQNVGREKELARTNADLNRANSAAAAAQGDEATLKRGYVNAIDKARSDYATSLKEISASSTMDAGLKTQTLQNLRVTYNTMISNYAKSLGWDANSWLIGDEAPAAVAPPTVTPPATGNEPRY